MSQSAYMLPLCTKSYTTTAPDGFVVTTATGSEYVVALLQDRKIMRKMAVVAPAVDFLHASSSELRRDEDELNLLMLENCRVGAPALFWIQVRNDHIPTLRPTSPVVSILPLD